MLETSPQENLLIGNDGRALLINFDCASRPGVTPPSCCVVGSLRWMAPECIDNHNITAGRDIWAFGMTVLVLCLFPPTLLSLILDCSIGIVHCTTALSKLDNL